MTGFRALMCSWKIIEISLPRSAVISEGFFLSRLSPRKRMSPAVTRIGGSGSSRMMLRAVSVLPQPLSPTMPTTSPFPIESDSSETMSVVPPAWAIEIPRFLVSRIVSSLLSMDGNHYNPTGGGYQRGPTARSCSITRRT
jgi:hypothetical protein